MTGYLEFHSAEPLFSSMNTPEQIIKQKCVSVVESYRFTQTKNINWASSLTKLAHATAQEYEDRFLIELIQNGYDVHDPTRSDGEIYIHFARSEGEFGTLYVANGGHPFTESNFHAICEIAQSDKEPGAGIGNKGVGFKSVLHVCDSPEVYSTDPLAPSDPGRAGFCFRFAQEDDYAELCNGHEELLPSLLRDVSPYFLPISIPSIPDHVLRLFELGMVSVIRMPLSRDSASNAVASQLDQVGASPVPVLLFLPRLRKLTIEETEDGNTVRHTAISRSQDAIAGPDASHRWSKVAIQRSEINGDGEDSTSPRSFFLAAKLVDSERLKAVIDESIAQNHLDDRFAEWTEEAAVSVAVELGIDTPADCRLYTFLPMGEEAKCPFGGHLNAPFAPNLARTHVNDAIPLNGLFFDVAAELAAETVMALSEAENDVPYEVLLDLLTWESPSTQRMVTAFENLASQAAEYPMLRLVSTGAVESRGSIAETYAWEGDFDVFTATNLSRITTLPFLAPVRGESRFRRLEDLFASLNYGLEPDDETLADWAESVADDLLQADAETEQWNDFYSDIEAIFSDCGEALEGRQILLDSSKNLRHAGPFRGSDASADKPAVFFPPTTERSEDDEEVGSTVGVDIPDNLQKFMCYMHDALKWYERDGATLRRTAARDFLQKSHLVHRFDTRSLVEHCSRISQSTRSPKARESSLRLAFNLQRAARSRDALGLEKLPFQVPTAGGWHLANDALFSERWSSSQGRQLAKLISHARSVSDDIASLQDHFIRSPSEAPFGDGLEQDWEDFLRRIGVRDGLWPMEMKLPRVEYRGDDVTKTHIGYALKMPSEAVEQWDQTHTSSQTASHPYTQYKVQTLFYRLPGQFEYSDFSDDAKNVYARLVFRRISEWDREHFSAKIARPRSSGKDTLAWPTPLVAFLRFEEWVPVQNSSSEKYASPEQAWHFDESDGGIAPSFLPLIPRDLRRQLEQSSSTASRLISESRLRCVGRQDDCAALVALLGELVAEGRVGETEVVGFRRLHRQAWQQLLDADSEFVDSFINEEQLTLAITRGSELVAMPIRKGGENCCAESLYVVDTDDRLRIQLLNDLRLAFLDVGPKLGSQIVDVLQPVIGDHIRRSGEVEVEVLVDEQDVKPSKSWPFLINDDNDWVKLLIALVIQLKSRVPTHRTVQAQSQVQKRLSLLRVCKGSTVSLRVDRDEAALPSFFHNVVLVNDSNYPTIAFADSSDCWTWDTLERLAHAITTAVERGSVQADLEVAIHRLSRVSVGEQADEPSNEDLADALSTSVDEVRAHLRDWRSQELVILEFLYPVMHHLLGETVASAFNPSTSSFGTKDEIRHVLDSHQDGLPITADKLLDQCVTAPTLAQLRDDLSIEFAPFNATLKAIGHPYKPFRNADGHRNEFAYFVQTNEDAILDRLRDRFTSEFRDGKSLKEYVDARSLSGLKPNSEWLDECELPSNEMLNTQVDDWLGLLGAKPLATDVAGLPALEVVRSENRKSIRRIAEVLTQVIPGWCVKNRAMQPSEWNDTGVCDTIAASMFDEGLTDFEPLARKRIFEWLEGKKMLPSGMPHSTEYETLGLSEEDLSKGESEAEKQRREREFHRRTIEIDGKRYSSSSDGYEALVETVRATVSPDFLKSSKSLSKLESVTGKSTKRGGQRKGGGGAPDGRMTDAQKHATGLVGELLAFEWLKSQYDGVTESCWKSKYHDLVFGGTQGDDLLGYDFEVLLKRGSYMFEVKATTGSDCAIELGATELETSQRFAKSNRYRILFIPNVLDADLRRVCVLPNPFSNRGRGMFKTTGTGIRFRFSME